MTIRTQKFKKSTVLLKFPRTFYNSISILTSEDWQYKSFLNNELLGEGKKYRYQKFNY
jgi:hypothetical protein